MFAALAAVAQSMKPPCGQAGHGEFGAGEWIGDEQALVWGRSESDSEEREKGEQVGRHGGETRWRGKAVMVSGARQIRPAECWQKWSRKRLQIYRCFPAVNLRTEIMLHGWFPVQK